jgi:hypothetical protein
MKKLVVSCLCAVSALTLLVPGCGNPEKPKEAIVITAPASAQKLLAGDTVSVTWTQSVADPKLSYNFNRGGGWQSFATVIPVDAQQAKVALPVTEVTDSFQIKVEDNGTAYNAGTTGLFSVRNIVLTSPAGGESFTRGATVPITWKVYRPKFSSLKCQLSTDGGKSFNEMFGSSISDFTPPKNWVIGAEPGWDFAYPSSECMLKISEYNNETESLSDVSGNFTVN